MELNSDKYSYIKSKNFKLNELDKEFYLQDETYYIVGRVPTIYSITKSASSEMQELERILINKLMK